MELLPPPLTFTDDACISTIDQQSFDSATTLLEENSINVVVQRCNIHDNRNPKNVVPFLKSNYKYKRRGSPRLVAACSSRPHLKNLVARMKLVEAKSCKHLTPTSSSTPSCQMLSYSSLEFVAVGLILKIIFTVRDTFGILLRRVHRESRVWWSRNRNTTCHKAFLINDHCRWRYMPLNIIRLWTSTLGRGYSRTSMQLTLIIFLISLLMSVTKSEAGTCWTERMENGKCKSQYGKNITKSECCGKNQMFSYSEKDLPYVEEFFVLAMDGGAKCMPCLENCKNISCGPNKRCAKRKGRPKCICSPQCGSVKKHKKFYKKKQNQQNASLSPHVIDMSRNKEQVSLVNYDSPITVRDVRSLSSEIDSNPSPVSSVILINPVDAISQSNSRRKSQRMTTPANPTKTTLANHLDQQTIYRGQQIPQIQIQQEPKATRRRHANTDRNKGDKLIITVDDLVRPNPENYNDLAKSNSLRDKTSNAAAVDNSDDGEQHYYHRHHHHHHNHYNRQHTRHPFKKHTRPNGDGPHDSVHSNTMVTATLKKPLAFVATATATTISGGIEFYREMKAPSDRRSHRPHKSTAANPLGQRFKPSKSTLLSQSSDVSNIYSYKNYTDNARELQHKLKIADDLTFEHKIDNGFFNNGFPYPHQELLIHEGRQYRPVCGSDGRTYNSECQLKKRACRTDNVALVVAYRGHCQTSCKKVKCLNNLQCVEDHYAIPHCIVCSIDCPMDDDNTQEIDPQRAVCGIDGNTYRSTCDINRMVCKIGRSIAVAYPGPCRRDYMNCDAVSCGGKMTCLSDLLTHRPRCVSCRFKCSRKRRPANLRYIEGKLCGTNNRTYHSWCEMKKDSCHTGFYIDIKHIGDCQQRGQEEV